MIVEQRLLIVEVLGRACFCCLDALHKDGNQLVAFGIDILQSLGAAQLFAFDDT